MILKNGEELTKKVAKRITLELWKDLAKTGKGKGGWDGWEKYGDMAFACPLCEYYRGGEYGDCDVGACPLATKDVYACLLSPSPFLHWQFAGTDKDRKKYAKLFLEQLLII